MKLEKKDKMIIRRLLDNGRMSFSDLATRCKISRQTAFNRVKRLKNTGVIEKFSVRSSHKKLGLDFKAYLLVTAEPGKKHREALSKFLIKKKQVSQIHYLFGRFDFFLEVIATDREELAQLLSEIHQFEAVNRTETFIVYDTIKYDPEGPVKRLLESG